MPIQIIAQKIEGMPVAFAILTASVGTLAPKGDERKKTVFKSESALRMHCTARKLTKKLAVPALAYLAMTMSPSVSTTPAISVNGLKYPHIPFDKGFHNP